MILGEVTPIIDKQRINEQIRVDQVLVIDAEGEKLGVMPTAQAMRMASDAGLDLVEVAPQAKPPVCRILDFGRYKYKQKKRKRLSTKKSHSNAIKEIRLRPKIEIHDLEIKVKRALEFLGTGQRVQLNLLFRGREMAHTELGYGVIQKFIEMLGDSVKVERNAKQEGRRMTCLVAPK